jgi:hypothetical protein
LRTADDRFVTGGWHVEREQLAELLGDQTEACGPASDALLGGGDFVVWDGLVPAGSLAGTYAVRLEHTQEKGIETLGLPESVEMLRRYEGDPLRLGRIGAPDGSWHFVLFLTSDASALLACAGVKQRGR